MTSTSNSNIQINPIPYRIRIGVSGTRTLPANKEKLAEVISRAIETQIPILLDKASKKHILSAANTPLAFSILTSLADGSDRLVAEVIMNLPESSLSSIYEKITGKSTPAGMQFPEPKLEPVIPLQVEDYRKTFVGSESVREFDRLSNQASRSIILRERLLTDDYPAGNEPEIEAARHRAFTRAGRYVVSNCDILIALLDSRAARGEGFTAETVEYARTKRRPIIMIQSDESSDLQNPFAVSLEKGHGLNTEAIAGLEMLNTRRLSENTVKEYLEDPRKNPFEKTDEGKQLPEQARTNVRVGLIPYYARVSEIAAQYRRFYQYVGLLVYCFAAFAVASVALGTLVHELAPYAFFTEFILLLAIFLMVFISDHYRVNKRWVENRYLAERLRSAMFFAACGAEVSQAHIPPFAGVTKKGSDWMLMAYNEIWGRLPLMRGCDGQSCHSLRDFVRKHWLEDQVGYHVDKASRARKWSVWLERTGFVVFVIAIFAPLFHLLFFNTGMELRQEWLEKLLTFAALTLPAVGAAIGGVRSHREFSRISKRSTNMEANLRELDDSLSIIDSPKALENLLYRIEDLMLYENQDWLMLMKPAKVHYVP